MIDDDRWIYRNVAATPSGDKYKLTREIKTDKNNKICIYARMLHLVF